MKIIRNWQDMEALGVDVLTGEACALNMRLLCDLDPDAAKSVAAMWGVADLAASWNHGDKDKGWRSAMFMPDTLFSVARWICAHQGRGFHMSKNDAMFVVLDNSVEFQEAYDNNCFWWCVNCDHDNGDNHDVKPDKCGGCGRVNDEHHQLYWFAEGSWRAPTESWSGTARNTHAFSGREE
jgi:hypothetical protein